jgi:hypothetical protein
MFAVLLIVGAGWWWTAQASAYIYWSNSNQIGRANLDGTAADQAFIVGVEPVDVVVDAQHIYWTSNVSGTIGRANLDGTGVEQDFISTGDGVFGLAVDGQHLYWTNRQTDTIGRANLDGTGVTDDFITAAETPTGVAVDGQHVYWTNVVYDGGPATIGRANLDGTGVDQSFIAGITGLPGDLALDAQHIYWANYSGSSVGRANIDGSGVNQRFIDVGGSSGLAIDAQHIYWGDPASSTVDRANLDGTDVLSPFLGTAFLYTADPPSGVAVDALSTPQPPPNGPHIELTMFPVEPSGSAPLDDEFIYVLHNDGTDPVFHVSIADDGCSPVRYEIGDTNSNQLLDPGETWKFECPTHYTAPGTYTDQATATGTDTQTGLVLTSTSQASVTVTGAGSGGNGGSGGGGPGSQLAIGESASPPSGPAPLASTYTYVLTNNGTDPLFHVSVSGSDCSPVAYQSGDANANQLLDPGETWTFTCSTTHANPGTYTDQATATGTSTQTGLPVNATSQATVTVSGGGTNGI